MKQLEEYRVKADNIMKDLDDEQRLKRKQLVDAETKACQKAKNGEKCHRICLFYSFHKPPK
jgi:hypothetical protein